LPHGQPRSEKDPFVSTGGTSQTDFVLSLTTLVSPPLVPEIRLRLAADAHRIFQVVRDRGLESDWPSYWAFAWPGGQAMARYLLDHPAIVRGKAVMDIGAGSGIAAIAAAMAGASTVVAADPDPLAAAAIAINARENGVEVKILTEDVLGREPVADLLLIADLVYEPELATRVTRFLESARARKLAVILADRTTGRRPPLDLSFLARYHAPLLPVLEESHLEDANVWRLEPAARHNAQHRAAR
jgi:predicted nicotinamide N-methyase